MIGEIGTEEIASLDNLAPQGGDHPELSSGAGSALIVVLGAATEYGDFGYALMGAILDVVYGSHRRLHCANLAQLRDLWGEETRGPVLITSDCPDTALSYLLTRSNIPILAFFDDPAAVLARPVLVENQALHDVVRFGTRRFSCLMGCTSSPHAHVFGSESQKLSLEAMVESVFATLGLESGEAAAQVVERMAAAEACAASASIEEILRRQMESLAPAYAARRFDAAEQALFAWFSANYGPVLRGQDCVIEWPLELFFVGQNGEPGDREIALIGGARYIFWGPYLHLPFGGWRAQLQFEVTDNLSGNEIEADVCFPATAAQIVRRQAKLPVRGYFQVEFDFANVDPNAALEIRVRLLKGAIEGRFSVRRVTLFPIEAPSETIVTPEA